MGFKFRLQSVLEHRAHLEDLALQEFAKRIQAQRQVEDQIAWLEQEHRRARAELEEKELSGLKAAEFQLANEYATVLRLQALRERARLPMLMAATDQARKKLMLARKDRLTLDTLRQRHLSRWQREELIREQKTIDEAAIGAHLRRTGS